MQALDTFISRLFEEAALEEEFGGLELSEMFFFLLSVQ